MTPRVLFLDDDKGRHRIFREWMGDRGICATHVETADACAAALKAASFDLVFLDHDLGGKTFVESRGAEPTGYTVTLAMSDGWQGRKPRVVVHSYNPVGAERMVRRLDEAGFKVDWRPFGPSMLDGLL